MGIELDSLPTILADETAARAVVQAGKVRRLAVTSGKRFPGPQVIRKGQEHWRAFGRELNVEPQ